VSNGRTADDFTDNKFSDKQEKAAVVENKIDWQRTKSLFRQ